MITSRDGLLRRAWSQPQASDVGIRKGDSCTRINICLDGVRYLAHVVGEGEVLEGILVLEVEELLGPRDHLAVLGEQKVPATEGGGSGR